MWIEIPPAHRLRSRYPSRPARALWIEIAKLIFVIRREIVEAREGLVD